MAEPATGGGRHYLFVSQYFWPESFRINDLAEALIEQGHRVTVLTGTPNYGTGKTYPEYRADPARFADFYGARVVRVPVIPRGNSKFMLLFNYVSFALMGCLYALFGFRREKFDAILAFQTSPITQALPALIMRRRKRAPVLLWVLDLWPETLAAIGVVKSPALLRLVGVLVRFVYRRSDRILVASQSYTTSVIKYGGSRAKGRYFPGWAETVITQDSVAAATPAPELAAAAGKFTVLFAGNIGEAQDFPAIIDAADALRDETDVIFAIVGDGSALAATRAEISARGLDDRFLFAGRHPVIRMPEFFAGADALLVSLRAEPVWALTVPGKVQAYMAAGKPILGMLDGAGADIIAESQGGRVGPAGDGAALAANIRELKAFASSTRREIGRSAALYCHREFDRNRMVSAFIAWAEEARQEMAA